MRHARARNVIERIFGVVKKRFAILRQTNNFTIDGQARVVPACCAVHNFIRIHDPDDSLSDDEDDTESRSHSAANDDLFDEESLGGAISRAETRRADERRNAIAEAMWEDYCARRRRRNRRR